jgi:hypothetical protein
VGHNPVGGLLEGLQALAVLLGADLAAGQPLGQDLLGAGPLLLVRLRLLVGLVGAPEQGDRNHGDQRPEAEHAEGHQQPAPAAHGVAVHHRDHLLSIGSGLRRQPPR